jgi:diketogulonate reductase-like aldo/keto reductase
MLALPSGEAVPALGQGTWNIGENRRRRADEIAALQVVGEAIENRRDDVFLVSKVLPHHANRRGTIAACHASLKRLGTEQLDLYLLHWRERVPLAETLAGFEELMRLGDIRDWGVSNFDTDDMQELIDLPGGAAVASNQVLYNLGRRGIEFDLLPWCRTRRVSIMAYSPIEQGRLLENEVLRRVAQRRGITAAQLALAWVLRQEGVIAIPKSASLPHVRENRAALDVRLTSEDLADLDAAFPPPRKKVPLAVL